MYRGAMSLKDYARLFLAVCIVAVLAFGLSWLNHRHTASGHVPVKRHRIVKTLPPKAIVEPPFLFPAGGRTLFPQHRFVALYGSPSLPQLGTLGEQSLEATMQRVKDTAAQYQPFSKEKVYPTLEIIASVAAADPTENGDYSHQIDLETLRPWIDAAKQSGVYVLLDLQPGLSSFPDQARQYEALLKEPHVGLALDPEWRLAPGQVHLQQIGSVHIDEVNATAAWLAGFTKQHKLPQKLFLMHQFRLSMLADRQRLDTSYPELAYTIQMDGHGTQPTKLDTWNTILVDAPANTYFGWKQFIDEDRPLASSEAVMQINPQPWYVSYQ